MARLCIAVLCTWFGALQTHTEHKPMHTYSLYGQCVRYTYEYMYIVLAGDGTWQLWQVRHFLYKLRILVAYTGVQLLQLYLRVRGNEGRRGGGGAGGEGGGRERENR